MQRRRRLQPPAAACSPAGLKQPGCMKSNAPIIKPTWGAYTMGADLCQAMLTKLATVATPDNHCLSYAKHRQCLPPLRQASAMSGSPTPSICNVFLRYAKRLQCLPPLRQACAMSASATPSICIVCLRYTKRLQLCG